MSDKSVDTLDNKNIDIVCDKNVGTKVYRKQHYHIIAYNINDVEDYTKGLVNYIKATQPTRNIVYFFGRVIANNKKELNVEIEKYNLNSKANVNGLDNSIICKMLTLVYAYGLSCDDHLETHNNSCDELKFNYNMILYKQGSVLNWRKKSLKIIENEIMRICKVLNIGITQRNIILSALCNGADTLSVKLIITDVLPLIELHCSNNYLKKINDYYLKNQNNDEDYIIILDSTCLNNFVNSLITIGDCDLTVY
jgi:hypothetical protein